MRDLLRIFAHRSGLYKPLRTLYHRTFYARRITTAGCAGITVRFSTPTPTIVEHVQSLTGEGPVLESFLGHLHEADVVWDVGAGFGLYALFSSVRTRGRGSVQAFEPEPGIRTLLHQNIGLNEARAISVHPFALGNSDGTTQLFASASPNIGTSALVQRPDYPLRETPASITLSRGDTLVADGAVPPPTVLKIDVEGAELLVLCGLAETLRRGSIRLICCEVHPRLLMLYGSSPEEFEHRLRASGFSVASRHPRGTEYHLLCLREGAVSSG
jgi:FkbM family methyltransferase